MYVRENKIKSMLISSKVLFVLGWISVLFWGGCLVASLMKKTDMQFAIATFFLVLALLGILELWISNWLKSAVLEARFLENVFANDLDGRIDACELSEVMGKDEKRIFNKLERLKNLCMQGFRVNREGKNFCVELESKKTKCICKNCGGEMEKKIYFTGVCPYCGSLDIFAQVISGNKLYSILHTKNESAESYFYVTSDADESMQRKEILMCMLHAGIMFFYLVCALLSVSDVMNGEREVSLPIAFAVFSVPFLFYMLKHYWNFVYIATARRFSKCAADITEPFISLQVIFVESLRNKYNIFVSRPKDCSEKKKLKAFREIQKRGYSRNCSLIHTEDGLRIGLKREIKKGVCPMCGSPLTGTLQDQCKCNYCGYVINDAIGKI